MKQVTIELPTAPLRPKDRHHVRIVLCIACALLIGPAGPTDSSGQNPAAADLLLVSLSGEDRIVLIRAGSGERVATFDAAGGPHEIAISSDGARGREIWRLRVDDGRTDVLSRCGS